MTDRIFVFQSLDGRMAILVDSDTESARRKAREVLEAELGDVVLWATGSTDHGVIVEPALSFRTALPLCRRHA